MLSLQDLRRKTPFSRVVIGGDDVIDDFCCATNSPTFRLRVIFDFQDNVNLPMFEIIS